MSFKKKISALAIGLLLALQLGAQGAPGGPITLQAALARNMVTADFNGTGASSGDSVKVKVKKTSKGPLVVTVPPGTMLRSSSGGYQNMVVSRVTGVMTSDSSYSPTSRIVLTDTKPVVTILLSAYCAEFQKENPQEYTTFSIEAPDPTLACIAQRGANLSVAALQAAVWIYTDRITFQSMSEKFNVSLEEFAAGRAVASRCGVASAVIY
jgi:hypothetical protein